MRSAGRLKLGYYPLPTAEGSRLRLLLEFPKDNASVLDPCAGTGAALHQLTADAAVSRYGVELDADRAKQSRDTGIDAIDGNIFATHGKPESVSFLYLNPPYDSEIGPMDNKRMEVLFLDHTFRWLIQGGVLLMVIQQRQLLACSSLLSAHFGNFQVLRLTDPEAERFEQVALFGVRKRISAAAYEGNRRALEETIHQTPLPPLTGNEPKYLIPPSPATQFIYRGLPLDRLEDLVLHSAAWKRIESFLLPKEEASSGQPITPLHAGHVGVLSMAGRLNGVFGADVDRHIARWLIKKYVTTFTQKEEGYTEIHKQERFSNEVVLLYENGRTLVLSDREKGEKDGERLPQIGAA